MHLITTRFFQEKLTQEGMVPISAFQMTVILNSE